ncbi:MAG TPA: 50S ribosomal protein L22 [Actinomycetota bacterium]|nr:50S ribosomal protein L22 [Actinomycetota bacterium]
MAKAAVQTYKAGAKFVRISPYKVREVAAIIKGKHVDEARRVLAFTPKAASIEMSKILESAIANAEHNFQVPQEELYIRFVSADEGVTIKRFRPRAQGRGFRIRKRTSHIQLELERRQEETVERPRRAPRKGAAASEPAAKGATKPATPKGGSKEDATTKGSAQSKGGSKPKPDAKGKSATEDKKGDATPKGGSAKGKATPSEKKASAGRSTAKAESAKGSKTKEGN